MDILEAMLGAQGGGATQQLARQFGLDERQVSSALGALVPALAAGFQSNMSRTQGLDGLLSALSGGGHRRYVDDVGTLGAADTVADGNGILGHVFGDKEVSREVARTASAQSGLGEGVLKAMLPVVAAMMMGTMAKRMAEPAVARAGVGMGGSAAAGPGGASLLSLLAPVLDSNRNGTIVDDVLGMLGGHSRR